DDLVTGVQTCALPIYGGHRCATPEETFARYQHHISPITGIVKNMTLVQASNDGLINVYLAGHNFAMKNDSLYFLRNNLRSKSCRSEERRVGKGCRLWW